MVEAKQRLTKVSIEHCQASKWFQSGGFLKTRSLYIVLAVQKLAI